MLLRIARRASRGFRPLHVMKPPLMQQVPLGGTTSRFSFSLKTDRQFEEVKDFLEKNEFLQAMEGENVIASYDASKVENQKVMFQFLKTRLLQACANKNWETVWEARSALQSFFNFYVLISSREASPRARSALALEIVQEFDEAMAMFEVIAYSQKNISKMYKCLESLTMLLIQEVITVEEALKLDMAKQVLQSCRQGDRELTINEYNSCIRFLVIVDQEWSKKMARGLLSEMMLTHNPNVERTFSELKSIKVNIGILALLAATLESKKFDDPGIWQFILTWTDLNFQLAKHPSEPKPMLKPTNRLLSSLIKMDQIQTKKLAFYIYQSLVFLNDHERIQKEKIISLCKLGQLFTVDHPFPLAMKSNNMVIYKFYLQTMESLLNYKFLKMKKWWKQPRPDDQTSLHVQEGFMLLVDQFLRGKNPSFARTLFKFSELEFIQQALEKKEDFFCAWFQGIIYCSERYKSKVISSRAEKSLWLIYLKQFGAGLTPKKLNVMMNYLYFFSKRYQEGDVFNKSQLRLIIEVAFDKILMMGPHHPWQDFTFDKLGELSRMLAKPEEFSSFLSDAISKYKELNEARLREDAASGEQEELGASDPEDTTRSFDLLDSEEIEIGSGEQEAEDASFLMRRDPQPGRVSRPKNDEHQKRGAREQERS